MSLDYSTIPAFERDFKKLEKRYKSLKKDFELMKRAAIELYFLHGIDNRSIVPIAHFCDDEHKSYKVRKIAYMALKSRGVNSGLRVVFVYLPQKRSVIFIEIYFKADQANENRARLEEFIKGMNEQL